MERFSDLNNIPVEFMPIFSRGIIPEYQELLKRKSNKRIRKFADKIIETGSRLDIFEFEVFGKELCAQVDSYNIRKIGILLDGFEEVKNTLMNNPNPN